VGLADYWSHEFKIAPVMSQLDAETPRIVLSHNPDTAAFETMAGGFATLRSWRSVYDSRSWSCGFTKRPPQHAQIGTALGAIHAKRLCQSGAALGMGFHQVGTNQLYINRGLGTYLPGRYCPPEVTVITLVAKSV